MIDAEASAALSGQPARIIAKINSLTDPVVIKALYAASQAGVQIDLIVRGICCLKPGLPNVSENIRVISTIGRFLEHSRVYFFLNNSQQVYCSSADWMERNLSHRIEVCFPIVKKKLASRILEEMEMHLEDQCQSWDLNADGEYKERRKAEKQDAGLNEKLNENLDECMGVQLRLLNNLCQA